MASQKADFTPVPSGVHFARCFRIVDLGTQVSEMFGEKRKVVFSFELVNLPLPGSEEGLNMSVNKFYGLTLHKRSTLCKDLQAWRGKAFTTEELKGFDIAKVLGAPCQVSIIMDETGRDRLDAIMAVPKGSTIALCKNPLVEYSIEQGKDTTYLALPEWVRSICDKCCEWKPGWKEEKQVAAKVAEVEAEAAAAAVDDSDIPF